MNQNLIQSARKLRLSGLLVSLEMRLQEATSHQLSAEQFLELVLQDELNVRAHRLVERRKKAAAFRELKPLDEFEWDFKKKEKVSVNGIDIFRLEKVAGQSAAELPILLTDPFTPHLRLYPKA